MVRLRAVVRGVVQGVGFRWFVSEQADALGISGWVKNRPDGSVELEAEGSPEALERFTTAVRRGPEAADVTDVVLEDLQPRGGSGFKVIQER